MRTSIIWLLMLMVMLASASAVIEDTNVTLRAGCVDNYGNLCTSQARWTIIQPDGTTLYNESVGDNDDYGISNFTIWLNSSGVWYGYVNFTDQNISREYNIVVEDYINQADASLSEEINMIGLYLFLAVIIISLFYLGTKMDNEHAIIKWFLVLISFLFIIGGLGFLNLTNTNPTIESPLNWAFYASIVITSVVFFYAMFYTLYVSLVNAGKIKGKNGEKQNNQG